MQAQVEGDQGKDWSFGIILWEGRPSAMRFSFTGKPRRKVTLLAAGSEEEMIKWQIALRKACGQAPLELETGR